MTPEYTRVAVIGTAGRDASRLHLHTLALYERMVARVVEELASIRGPIQLVSGGAAWADHVAVTAHRTHGYPLHLRLPAELRRGQFYGTQDARTANHYHLQFGQVLGRNTLMELQQVVASSRAADPKVLVDYHADFAARNFAIGYCCEVVLAMTWGEGDVPADGGTKRTWDTAVQADRRHISLLSLVDAPPATVEGEV